MTENNKLYDVCIIGAGYSGLVLAIKLARAGLLVCLAELNRMMGRRILSTGNGRCNFTNRRMEAKYYYSNSKVDFIDDNFQEILDFIKDLGVVERELDGYYYPITNQAKTIREALENEVNALGIDVFLDNRVVDVSKADNGFTVATTRQEIHCKNAVVSSGGLSAATLGSTKIGYKIAQKFGLKVTKLAPSLVGATSKDICLKELAGVRALGTVDYKGNVCEGEIQFNKDGVSGYPVMCISRFIGLDELNKNVGNISVDFCSYISEDDLKAELKNRFAKHPKSTILQALVGLCNEKIIDVVVSYARIYSDTVVEKLDDEDIDNIVYYLKHFSISLTGTKGFDSSQVTAGGVDLSDINMDSLEARNCPGLYFTGEVLDVDGICGGYNLSWAYTSADRVYKHILDRGLND